MNHRWMVTLCVALVVWAGMGRGFAPALASVSRSSQDPPPTETDPPQPRVRTFGRLPDWATRSWYVQRQLGQTWMLTNANVIDIHNGEIRHDVNIVIAADLIKSIGDEQPTPGMQVIDAADGYVMPGLFDLHAHVLPTSQFFPDAPEPTEALRLLLEAGVTTIRLIPFYSESALLWAAQVNHGELIGPTIVPTSSVFEKEAQRTMRGFRDLDTAAAWVRKEAMLGARWIKIYNRMDEDSLRTIVATARAYGMKVCGHANEVPPHRAAALGLDTLEHATSLAYSAVRDDAPPMPGDVGLVQAAWCWEHVDAGKLDELMDTFKEYQTGWVPTLVVLEQIVASGGHDDSPFDPHAITQFDKALRQSARLAVGLHRDGGLVGIGSDFPIDGVLPGVSVHRELELLVELGGATPLEALQIATLSSARILGFDALVGSVEPGRVANLIVCVRNPLEDISNIRSVARVIHNGRLHETEPPQ